MFNIDKTLSGLTLREDFDIYNNEKNYNGTKRTGPVGGRTNLGCSADNRGTCNDVTGPIDAVARAIRGKKAVDKAAFLKALNKNGAMLTGEDKKELLSCVNSIGKISDDECVKRLMRAAGKIRGRMGVGPASVVTEEDGEDNNNSWGIKDDLMVNGITQEKLDNIRSNDVKKGAIAVVKAIDNLARVGRVANHITQEDYDDLYKVIEANKNSLSKEDLLILRNLKNNGKMTNDEIIKKYILVAGRIRNRMGYKSNLPVLPKNDAEALAEPKNIQGVDVKTWKEVSPDTKSKSPKEAIYKWIEEKSPADKEHTITCFYKYPGQKMFILDYNGHLFSLHGNYVSNDPKRDLVHDKNVAASPYYKHSLNDPKYAGIIAKIKGQQSSIKTSGKDLKKAYLKDKDLIKKYLKK